MLQLGEIVRTSYNTGPFRIVEISEICTCAEYVRELDGDDSPSEPHYHLTCVGVNNKKTYWLNGHRADGTSVWDDDYLIFEGVEANRNLDLFSVV